MVAEAGPDENVVILVGIDPGVTGAIAIINQVEDEVITWDMPVSTTRKGGKQVDIPTLAGILREVDKLQRNYGASTPVKLELVHAMPKQGVSSTFNFGMGYGAIQGALQTLGIPLQFVTPQKWKKAAGLIGADKDYARTKALQIFPSAELHLKKHIGRADALLIAKYG